MISDGKLSIARVTSSHRAEYVVVVVRDGLGLEVRAEMHLDAFALAITGKSEQTCVVDVRNR
jgi:hypothetical protein